MGCSSSLGLPPHYDMSKQPMSAPPSLPTDLISSTTDINISEIINNNNNDDKHMTDTSTTAVDVGGGNTNNKINHKLNGKSDIRTNGYINNRPNSSSENRTNSNTDSNNKTNTSAKAKNIGDSSGHFHTHYNGTHIVIINSNKSNQNGFRSKDSNLTNWQRPKVRPFLEHDAQKDIKAHTMTMARSKTSDPEPFLQIKERRERSGSLPSAEIRSVLKSGRARSSNPRDHMIADRPIKTVTFVDTVTVVTVY